ncbi:GNAT family N-acetyltransferase [Maribacter sp. X9]|uniref:GNAT family N-acetyltransferase n=1 Tax=Maribacter sp. X9 TaxID=3402159 RepID=UPI003AF378ED
MLTYHFDNFIIEPVHEKYAWRICDLMTTNSDRFKRFFPQTLQQNLTPTLSQYFVANKVRQFAKKEEFLFVLKEIQHRTIMGLVYIKEIDWVKKEAELAYCIGYQYEGKGYTTKSVKALSHYAFNELKLETLRIIAHKSNQASIRVAEKCGYLWIETLPKAFTPPKESALDMELYVLENEG